MATITKLPSGSYRIRKMHQGKTYALTLDYKPGKREADLLLDKSISEDTIPTGRLTFEGAAQAYISDRSKILSPSTVREYTRILKSIPVTLRKARIDAISTQALQSCINAFSASHSPKSVRDFNSFIVSVLRSANPSRIYPVLLPQKIKKDPYIPSDRDIRLLLDAIRGHETEVPILLGIFGLRRSEICALRYPEDFEGNIVRISRALVENVEKRWVEKGTKTTDSTRSVPLPEYVMERIREKGYIYSGSPGNISKHMKLVQTRLGLPHFSLHKLRHYFASSSHAMGIPDAVIMSMGGWKTETVMKSVYRHAQEDTLSHAAQKYMDHFRDLAGNPPCIS